MQPRVSPVTGLTFPFVRWVASRSRLLRLGARQRNMIYHFHFLEITPLGFIRVLIRTKVLFYMDQGIWVGVTPRYLADARAEFRLWLSPRHPDTPHLCVRGSHAACPIHRAAMPRPWGKDIPIDVYRSWPGPMGVGLAGFNTLSS